VIGRAVVFGAGRLAYHGCSAVVFEILGLVEAMRNVVECEREEGEEVRSSVHRLPERVK
jgi:hypothetical protein